MYTPVVGEDSSSDEDDETGDSEDGMEVDGDDSDLASCSRVTRSQTRKKQQEEFVEPEPGWTTVHTKRK